MPGRLEHIGEMLRAQLGSAFLSLCPRLPSAVNEHVVRFSRTLQTPVAFWDAIDSALFNTIYAATDRTMLVELDDGCSVRVTEERIRDLADRILALAYEDKPPEPALRDALFDLARSGSFAAMRALCARFPLDPHERHWLEQVLAENGQTS